MLNSKIEAKEQNVLVVIPTYNNAGTVARIIEDVKHYVDDILVVNDGSSDQTLDILESVDGIQMISYSKNRGKGYALRLAIKYAYEKGYRYIITIDSDGQHYPENIIDLLQEIKESPDSLIVGARNIQADNMPSKNSFANKFSNFWFLAETGQKMSDTQSGYRLYPVKLLQNMSFITTKYEFELEIIVRAVWRGVTVKNIPVKVYYPPVEERVSHFRPFRDFTRISILNSILVIIALLYYYPKCFFKKCNYTNFKQLIDKNITNSRDSNIEVAMSIGLGICFGIIPIWGYQMIVAAFVAHLLKLNKVITLIASNISIPPMIPFILYGSYITGGLLLNGEVDFKLSEMSLDNIKEDLFQYVIGSVAFAFISGGAMFILSYLLMTIFKRKPKYE